jgi:hypothetical protein
MVSLFGVTSVFWSKILIKKSGASNRMDSALLATLRPGMTGPKHSFLRCPAGAISFAQNIAAQYGLSYFSLLH